MESLTFANLVVVLLTLTRSGYYQFVSVPGHLVHQRMD